MHHYKFIFKICLAAIFSPPLAADMSAATEASRNKPERIEQFRDFGFGLFIHWSIDSQIGSVISHSLVGASTDYQERFFEELPQSFNPRNFHPEDWADQAKLAGVRYVVFTAKHHSGFTMWPTETSGFGLNQTPFQRDVTREILDAFRSRGIAAGLYFSPDDFWWMWREGVEIQRSTEEVTPSANPGLMALDLAQVRELFTQYGNIDAFFIDGPAEGLRDLAWDIQPSTVVTRGALFTPEQVIPGIPRDEAWEACLTMGTQWQYKPTNEDYKTGGEIINLLVETRAKGGNLLLNVGPKPNGELPIEQEERLREVALWMYINSECIYSVRPWVITNENDVWFTQRREEGTIYAIVKQTEHWVHGKWRNITLKSVRASSNTKVSILGQNDRVLEYHPDVIPKSSWTQDESGLHLRVMRAQRVYNNRNWPNPIVIKLTNVEPAFTPPDLITEEHNWIASGSFALLQGRLIDPTGESFEIEAGYEYRDATALDLTKRHLGWIQSPRTIPSKDGAFSVEIPDLMAGHVYDIRPIAYHPISVLYGEEFLFVVP